MGACSNYKQLLGDSDCVCYRFSAASNSFLVRREAKVMIDKIVFFVLPIMSAFLAIVVWLPFFFDAKWH